jgi:hypothetical protein
MIKIEIKEQEIKSRDSLLGKQQQEIKKITSK